MYLYSIFHGNLNYSSISPKIYENIIDTCYWPLLDIINDYDVKPGIEFPLNTIKKIQEIDPLFLDELKKVVQKNKCELIFSGYEQTVFPLVPSDVNSENLLSGKKEQEELFKINIDTAYVNEQQFSSGLIPLYDDAKIKNIFITWEWMSKITDLSNQTKFFPKQVFKNTSQLNVIWNSFISFQKFQRLVDGLITKKEYLNYILNQKLSVDSCFPWYGSDMEIFGYKNPVLGLEGKGNEISRFRSILDDLEKSKSIKFELPSKILEIFKPTEKIEMASAKFAISGKKQDKFVITRWATCGRDNSSINTKCHKLLKKIRQLKSLKTNTSKNQMNELVNCWASDYRTHTTEQKFDDSRKKIFVLENQLNETLSDKSNSFLKKQKSDIDVILFNPHKNDWLGIPYEIKIHFSPKKNIKNFLILSNGIEIPSQIEDKKFYKNGNLRSALIVIEPIIPAKSNLLISIIKKKTQSSIVFSNKNNVTTKNVKLSLMKNRGGTIRELVFPLLSKKPMIKFLEHGTFHDTKLSADFYSGHSVIFSREGQKITDLVKTSIVLENNSSIRVKLSCEMDLPFGHLRKIFYVYQNHPRVDVKYIFDFKSFRPGSFRTGILTLNPEGFDRNSLQFSTHNGGELETFLLNGNSITQDESSDPRLSSQGCMGATEGIFDFGDKSKGITIFSDKSKWYSVPLLNYNNIDEKFFFRISNSVSELDDTTMTWWKGRKEFSFSILGRTDNILENTTLLQTQQSDLFCISNNKDITILE